MPIEKHRSPEERILFFLQSRNLSDGLDLYFESFSRQNPPTKEFFREMISGLRSLRAREEAFAVLEKSLPWFGETADYQTLKTELLQEYYCALVEKGKDQFEASVTRSKEFSENAQTKIDVLVREKLEEENRNTLRVLYQQALDDFIKATLIQPDGLAALHGVFRCYLALGDSAKAQEVETHILSLAQAEDVKKKEEAQKLEDAFKTKETPKVSSPEDYVVDLQTLKKWFSQKKYQEVIRGLSRYIAKHPSVISGYLLGAKANLELHEFHQAASYLERALKVDPYSEEAIQFKLDFLEKKYLILTRASSEYLNKGIQLGPAIGRLFFEKAVSCLERALEVSPMEIVLLDQLFTSLMYLRRTEEASKVRQQILLQAPEFITQWEKGSDQSWCFIASYAFSDAPGSVDLFRKFRREFLLNHWPGRLFNALYIRLSPLIVLLARRAKVQPVVIRRLLEPMRQFIKILCGSDRP